MRLNTNVKYYFMCRYKLNGNNIQSLFEKNVDTKREMNDEASKDELTNQIEEYKKLIEKCKCLLNLKSNLELIETFFRVSHERLNHEIENEMKKSEESFKEMTLQTLIIENTNLTEKSSTLSDETLTYLDSLKLCIQDIKELSSVWIDLVHEKDINLDTSLGYSEVVKNNKKNFLSFEKKIYFSRTFILYIFLFFPSF